ncbi:Aldose reductase [Nosema granulosis]|uniref:Aldose reductase n=1 Tax=Nosema granulosis TaxID=83296 RepID=A0A9P6GYJ4_9MICR|nr:Aldose reductase [Nosema granulosis]
MVGMGTWQSEDIETLERSIRCAIDVGYRHIDTAHIYGNEKALGDILQKLFKEKKIKREELFITSKLFNNFHKNPELGIQTSLKDLQLDYLDLYLIHWPVTFKTDAKNQPIKKDGKTVIEEFDAVALWRHMESFVEKGYTRSIGYSNFGKINTEKILSICKIKPAVAQFEIHPYLSQDDLVNYYQKKGIRVVSYSSLGSTAPNKLKVREDPNILRIAKKYNKTVSQVILSWLLMRNILIIPKSTNAQHIKENSELFKLEDEDFKVMGSLNKNYRYVDLAEWGEHRFD